MTGVPKCSRRIALIMAGGKGTRFWPRSRSFHPKQFLKVIGDSTLLQQTVHRLYKYFNLEDIFILTAKEFVKKTTELLPDIPPSNILIEPEGRNTAPCLALSLVLLEQLMSDSSVMVVLSADAWIGDESKFFSDIDTAVHCARNNNSLVTIGIHPTYPETGYGYIEATGSGPVLNVKSFCEKPDHKKAVEYLQSGYYYWNSGIFIWTLRNFRTQLLKHCKNIIKPLDVWITNGRCQFDLLKTYSKLEKISIDYALMEKANRVMVIPASFRWSDIGSWSAVSEFYKSDESGNVKDGDALLIKTNNCSVFGRKRFIAGIGLSDLIIVDEPDALLVCHKDNAQDVKMVVDNLNSLSKKHLI